jgi:hypothetical protein
MLDKHGQPIRPFPVALIGNHGKAVDQLIGFAYGVLSDGVIVDAEAQTFSRMVDMLYSSEPVFPFDHLKERLDRIFSDGHIDEDEKEELRAILQSLGSLRAIDDESVESVACSFPLDRPPPMVDFIDQEFVVTGRFAYGTRAKVHDAIKTRGGYTHDNVRQATRYLVIGHFASRDWLHTSYGTKILRASELRMDGHGIAIISEDHWLKHLPQ